MLIQASKGQRTGQSCIKIVFDVPDVVAFRGRCRKQGLTFGPIHRGEGYAFANTRDPAKNLVQISSRKFKKQRRSLAAPPGFIPTAS